MKTKTRVFGILCFGISAFGFTQQSIDSTKVEQLKEEAFQKLKNNATLLKANAVVGISTDVEIDGTTGGISISVVGTAVLCGK